MICNKDNYRLARIEALEVKNLLAGDVLVSVVDGALNIDGDAAANQIAVTAGAEARSYVITGLEGTNLRLVDPITELPGPAVATLTVTDIHGRTNVDLGDGDDEFALFDAEFRGKLRIETGDGNDTVAIGAETMATAELAQLLPEDVSVAVKGSLHIDTGIGDDEIGVSDAAVIGHLKIESGDGADIVSLGGSTAAPALDSSDLPDPVLRVFGAIAADLGEGDDELSLIQVRTHGSVHIDSALGDDSLDISLSKLSHLSVEVGDGADDVELVDSVFAALKVDLGDGDDLLATANLRAKLAFIAGGEGEDSLDELEPSDIVHRIVRGVEIPPLNDELPIFRRFRGLPLFGRLLS